MSVPGELDRLIEEGLALYGQGDLDAALLLWEQVLAEDPANEQANSYVDYVRMNYDMLTSDGTDEAVAPFGIADDNEPEYLIEISEGELPPQRASAPMYMDPMDAGWMIQDELMARKSSDNFEDARTGDEPLELELEADEPPDPDLLSGLPMPIPAPPISQPISQRAITANNEISFDDDTREYEGRRRDFSRAESATNEFAPEGTPGFSHSSQVTDVKRRDTGFVKARSDVPELKMTLRTPEFPKNAHEDPTKEELLQKRASEFEKSYARAEPWKDGEGEIDLPEAGNHAPIDSDDLIASLPSPKAAHVTRDLPGATVRPAPTGPPASTTQTPVVVVPPKRSPAVQAAIESIDLELGPSDMSAPVSSTAKTRDLVADNQDDRLEISFAEPATHTRDFTEKPTLETPRPPLQERPAYDHNPIISAPTRELGLRPGARAPTEDEPTKMNQRIRPERAQPAPDGTRADIVLPFDPIDARTSQILEDVDANAPDDEAKEDRTRRRISTLLERAQAWANVDLERAVAAVDLALSEDPNSALAQKLIHRNRDTIMNVFQAYMGDLDRQPELARPLHELASAPISPRAAFLLSRVDGSLSLDEILDVSGMPRLEAYRYLAQLFLRGILR